MHYDKIITGIFIERPNRFIAIVDVDGTVEKCHVKNTGRCRELLINGVKVILSISDNPDRATKYDLIAVYKGDRLINMDSQAPNKVALESISNIIGNVDLVQPEHKYGRSRIDLYAEKAEDKYLVEVKGVTLEKDSIVLFPDAPTERGLKHIHELIDAKIEGYRSYIVFIVQMGNIDHFEPNYDMQPEFGKALEFANSAGVNIVAYDCNVTEDTMILGSKIPVILDHSYSV